MYAQKKKMEKEEERNIHFIAGTIKVHHTYPRTDEYVVISFCLLLLFVEAIAAERQR